jgi:CRP-like cAMP-binding protein
MSLQDAVTLLARTPLFQGVDPVRLEVLAFTGTHLAYEAGDTLVEEGSAADGAILLLSGEAVTLSEGGAGPRRAARLDRGDLFGEVSLAQTGAWTATVRAAAPVEVLKLERDVFLRLADEFPEIAQGCFRSAVGQVQSLGAELRALDQRLVSARDKRTALTTARRARKEGSSGRQNKNKDTGRDIDE